MDITSRVSYDFVELEVEVFSFDVANVPLAENAFAHRHRGVDICSVKLFRYYGEIR